MKSDNRFPDTNKAYDLIVEAVEILYKSVKQRHCQEMLAKFKKGKKYAGAKRI